MDGPNATGTDKIDTGGGGGGGGATSPGLEEKLISLEKGAKDSINFDNTPADNVALPASQPVAIG